MLAISVIHRQELLRNRTIPRDDKTLVTAGVRTAYDQLSFIVRKFRFSRKLPDRTIFLPNAAIASEFGYCHNMLSVIGMTRVYCDKMAKNIRETPWSGREFSTSQCFISKTVSQSLGNIHGLLICAKVDDLELPWTVKTHMKSSVTKNLLGRNVRLM